MAKKPAPKDGPDKLRPDVAETAFRTMLEATGQAPKTDPETRGKNQEAVVRGEKGGRVGGKARSLRLSQEEKRAAGSKAARKRWGKSEDS